jgi:hypothetical protein
MLINELMSNKKHVPQDIPYGAVPESVGLKVTNGRSS